MYYQVSERDLEIALQFWSPGQPLNLCVMRKDHIPYLRHNIIHMVGQPDRIIGTQLYYNRVPIQLFCMDEDNEIPQGSFYIEIDYDDYMDNYGYSIFKVDRILKDATILMSYGIHLNVERLVQVLS